MTRKEVELAIQDSLDGSLDELRGRELQKQLKENPELREL